MMDGVDFSISSVTIIIAAVCVVATLVMMCWSSIGVRARKDLGPITHQLETVSKQVSDILGGTAYVRDSIRSHLLDKSKAALAPTKTLKLRAFATAEQRRVAKPLDAFVVGSAELVSNANRLFVASELAAYADFFDSVERQPLTEAQRRSCVTNEDNNLILAGAGTGKTSTMIGRARYLVASERARPDELLMLAFARKAAAEMQDRLDSRLDRWLATGRPVIRTFHALGLEVIGTVEGRRPDLHLMAEDTHAFRRFIDAEVLECCKGPGYRAKFIRYFGSERFPYRNPFDFDSMSQYLEYVRTNELRTLKGEAVKSFEECVIANYLSSIGVDYEYERPYEIETAGPDYRQYRPDFYLPEYRVYIEHFALDKSGNPPRFFDQAQYLAGIDWKRKLHTEHGTQLVETYSYLKREGTLESRLSEALEAVGVELAPRSNEELLEELRSSSEVSEFAGLMANLVTRFKESDYSFDELHRKAASDSDSSRLRLLLELCAPILDAYQAELARSKRIDFSDMIRKATDHVESGRFRSPYKHVLVDEFQDISRARVALIRSLSGQRSDTVLFAVGDDWQSIYRFTGSDIAYTRDFPDHFGVTATTPLETTFRFNDRIGELSSTFVLRNSAQIPKTIDSLQKVSNAAVSLIRTVRDEDGLRMALTAIADRCRKDSAGECRTLVLGRYNFNVDEWRTPTARHRLHTQYPSQDIDFMTVHSAKGKEADNVVILGLGRGKNGFPSEKPTDPILEWLLPPQEPHPFAEERRLFYVALTRARHRVYLVYNPMEASTFVRELLSEGFRHLVCADEIPATQMCEEIVDVPCPNCHSGALIPKSGPHGAFVACNNFPYCTYKERPCPQCGALMRRDERLRVCTNPACDAWVPICPVCGGMMVERSGPHGRFWGCSNYRKNAGFVCTYTINIDRFANSRVSSPVPPAAASQSRR